VAEIRSISAVTFTTPNMTRAVRFYKAAGFSIARGGETDAFVSFRVGKGSLNLARVAGRPPSTRHDHTRRSEAPRRRLRTQSPSRQTTCALWIHDI